MMVAGVKNPVIGGVYWILSNYESWSSVVLVDLDFVENDFQNIQEKQNIKGYYFYCSNKIFLKIEPS